MADFPSRQQPHIYDISVPVRPEMPVWPGDPRPEVTQASSLTASDAATVTRLCLGTHTGTHVDAPAHILAGGATMDNLPLDMLVGACYVAETAAWPAITAQDLEALCLPRGTTRLLLKTVNSQLWGDQDQAFRRDFAALAPDAASWLVSQGLRLVGVDYLSVEAYDAPADHPVHRTLLAVGVVLLEGLDLRQVPAGSYTLICLPLRIAGVEGAPARAILLA